MTPEPRETWVEGDLTFTELIAQPYSNCVFAAGHVEGHAVDTIYLRWERDNDTERMIMLRPDEAVAIIQVLSGALWSALIDDV
jgi:hypothetical protein